MCCVRICLFHEVKKDNIIFSNNYIIMSISLDGHTSFIGTEFIKLLNTGSSHLATEQYVNDAIAEGGGGGGGDLSNYYTQTQTDNLLNAKLNVNNPQDILGNLRLDPTNGLSKIILNAVSPPNANDDFYCNGSAHINGTLRVSLLTSDGDLNADGVNADVFNSNVITNDIIFNHNDVEYMRFNATDDEIQLSKNIELNEDLIMKSTKVLYLDATSNLLRYITTRNDNGQDILELVNNKATNNQIRFTNNGSTSMIVDNSFVFSERQIQGNNGLKVDYIDTRTANANFDFRRNNVSYITFQSDRVDINQPLHLSDALTIDVANKLTMAPSLEGGVNIFDIRNLHPVADNPMIRFRVGEGGGETIVCEMTNNAVSFQRNVILGTSYELRTNAIDTVNDNDLVFSRNNVPFMTLDKFTEDVNGTPTEMEAIILSKQLRANAQLRVNNLQINQFSSGVQYTDIRLHNADSVMRFYVGNSTSANFQITHAGISLNRETTISSVKTNTIDTNGDNDLVIRRNGSGMIQCGSFTGGGETYELIDVQAGSRFSSYHLYTNRLVNRTASFDTFFEGSNADGSGHVEYMRWNYTDQSLDFNAPIDNTNIAVIGNIVDTTVSDERLKTNIQDVESNYCNCVKNVKIKTFEYKDEKYKDSDKYGMIAQDLRAHLPKEFKNIVRETKPKKDEGEAYLSINYMKLSVVLWGALQETLNKLEHMEASIYELQEELKEYKKTKSKK